MLPQRVVRRAEQQRQPAVPVAGALLAAQGGPVALPLGREHLTRRLAQAAGLGAPLVARVLVRLALPALPGPAVVRHVAHDRNCPDVRTPVALLPVRAGPQVPTEPQVRVAQPRFDRVPPMPCCQASVRLAQALRAEWLAQQTVAALRVVHALRCQVAAALPPHLAQRAVPQPVDPQPRKACCRALLPPGQSASEHVQRVGLVRPVEQPAVALLAARAPVPVACHVAHGRGCPDWLTLWVAAL